MPRPVPTPLRRAVCRRWRRGQPARAIAEDLGLAPRTVRRLLRRLRQGGPDALRPAYRRPLPADGPIRRAALRLRRGHPGWGAPLIRVLLRHDFPRADLPSARTLQRWLRAAGLAPAPAGRRPRPDPGRARRPHAVWQMDACDRVRLAGGRRVCWLRLVDEHTGAVLRTAVFPPGALVRRGRPPRAVPAAAGLRPLGPARGTAGR